MNTQTCEREQTTGAKWKWKHLYLKAEGRVPVGFTITALCGATRTRRSRRGGEPVRRLRTGHCPLCIAVWTARRPS